MQRPQLIRANAIVGCFRQFDMILMSWTYNNPGNEGKKLAEKLLADKVNWPDIEIDVSFCQPALLISVFFNTFFQTIKEQAPDQLEAARNVLWRTRHEFQEELIQRWAKDFR